MFGKGKTLTFRDYVQGTWGSFSTPAGRVDYIMTKARLGEDSEEPERQLTKSLAPVREVMLAGDLDFNQLLQRDLDDHRVAVNLIPYLLTPKATGPAFFPPIVAVLLPFRSQRPSRFSALIDGGVVEDDEAYWKQQTAGSSFQVQRLCNEAGHLHPASVGKLWWNKSEAQLVVLDGQHRAMALLAVERTMTNGWQTSAGARFRSFYEQQVRHALSDRGDVDLKSVEVPVIVCWFPEQTGDDAKPHEAARKLFVDVNKEARPPSESRIILLSDAELGNVLTRRLLNELRSENNAEYLPLYAVEYDNPDTKSVRPARWSVLTNIHLLKAAVDRVIFGPQKYLKDVTQKIGSRTSQTERDSLMRDQLDIPSLFPDEFDDGGFMYQRDRIGDRNFPLGKSDAISERFASTWGRAILTLLSQTAPYDAHAKALTQLKNDWHIDDTGLTLAHDALFGGVGVFWTLRDSYNHYQDQLERGARSGKSDVIKAWEALRNRENEFESYRARYYLTTGRSDALERSKAAYAVFNTQACQLGLVLTLGSLWELRKQADVANLKDLPSFAIDIARALNAFFATDAGKAHDRRLAFSKGDTVRNPLNQIATMDTAQSVYFRYFWLEALATPEAWPHVRQWLPDTAAFRNMLDAARGLYFILCKEQQLKALKTSRPGDAQRDLEAQAEKTATTSIQRALRDWFSVTDGDFDHWLIAFKHKRSHDGDAQSANAQAAADEQDEEDSGDSEQDGLDDEPITDVSQLLGD